MGRQASQHLGRLGLRLERAQVVDALDASDPQRLDLILHQGIEGRDGDAQRGLLARQQGWQLVAEGLPASGGKDHQRVLPLPQGRQGLGLARAEGLVAELGGEEFFVRREIDHGGKVPGRTLTLQARDDYTGRGRSPSMLPAMPQRSPKTRLTAKLAIATSAMTLLLLVAGGLVWSTGSALACPDWPLCYGEFFPAMRGQVLFEHGHRLIAASVASLTVVLAVRTFSDVRLRSLSLLALGLVLGQALLGGLTVLLKLPLLVRVLHLATSQAFFAAILVLTARAIQLGSDEGSGTPKALAPVSPGTSRALGFAAAAVYLQLLLGALVRHTGSALACQSALLCDGRLWPAGFGPGEVQMLHRLWALCAGTLVIWATVRALPELRRSTSPFPRALAISAHGLLLVQIALGVSSVLSFLAVPVVTAHLAVGALLWGDLVLLWVLSRNRAVVMARDELERFGPELART